MYLGIIRRGIEFDAELAFNNLPEPSNYQSEFDVVEAVLDQHFEKFLHMTSDIDTEEAAEERGLLLRELGTIAKRVTNLVGIWDHIDNVVETRKTIHAKVLGLHDGATPKI
jgi:hypothetical protein